MKNLITLLFIFNSIASYSQFHESRSILNPGYYSASTYCGCGNFTYDKKTWAERHKIIDSKNYVENPKYKISEAQQFYYLKAVYILFEQNVRLPKTVSELEQKIQSGAYIIYGIFPYKKKVGRV